MKIMIVNSFYSEFELYEVPEQFRPDFLDTMARLANGEEDEDFPSYTVIGSQDDTETAEALEMADEVIFIEDLEA